MKTSRSLAAVVAVSVVCAATLLFAGAALREFAPPRTAVVDIGEVFERYTKKMALEERLKVEAEKAEAKYKDLETRLEKIEEERKLLDPNSSEQDELFLRKTKLQLEIKNLQKQLMDEFQQKHLEAVRELRDEIAREIERYAVAHELDLVLEKRFSAESRGASAVKWPIVHFAKPEIEITNEIVEILNTK